MFIFCGLASYIVSENINVAQLNSIVTVWEEIIDLVI